MKKSKLLIILAAVIAIALPSISADSNPFENELADNSVHNCRIWAALSDNMPDSIIYNDLIGYPNSLEHLSQINNVDGWGIAYYGEYLDSVIVQRGALRAHQDPQYDMAVVNLEELKPKISLAHIRRCSSGCCAHNLDSIPDPHPYIRFKNGRYWSFIHNGSIDKDLLYEMIGPEYLEANPLNGSFIPECDPDDTSQVTDSELFFLFLLKSIEENNWNVGEGLILGLVDILRINYNEALNFVLTDGHSLWAFKMGRTLFYIDDTEAGYQAVASEYPTQNQERWQEMNDHELVILESGQSPQSVDITPYLPSVTGTIFNPIGLPVGDVMITVTGTTFYTRSNTDGTYSLNCLSIGEYTIRYRHSYYADTLCEPIIIPEDSLVVANNVQLRYPGRLSGTIDNLNGDPAGRTAIILRGPQSKIIYSDSAGYFFTDSLNPGLYDISLRHNYYADTTLEDVGVFSDSTTSLGFALNYPAVINGWVTNDNHDPVDNMLVNINSPYRVVLTDTTGYFMFDSLEAGTFDIGFYHVNYGDTALDELTVAVNDTLTVNLTMTFLGYAYLPGDVNMFLSFWPPRVIGSDVTYLLNYFSGSDACPPCSLGGLWASADANGDCSVTGQDITRLISFFRDTAEIEYCPGYSPQWLNIEALPQHPPQSWPACEFPVP